MSLGFRKCFLLFLCFLLFFSCNMSGDSPNGDEELTQNETEALTQGEGSDADGERTPGGEQKPGGKQKPGGGGVQTPNLGGDADGNVGGVEQTPGGEQTQGEEQAPDEGGNADGEQTQDGGEEQASGAEQPVLLKVAALLPTGEEEIPFEAGGLLPASEYSGWEPFTRLCLIFSEPVDLSGLASFIAAEPSQPLVLESAPGYSNRAVFRFAEFPAWGSPFTFRLAPGVKGQNGNESAVGYAFRLKTAGPFLTPPALVGMRLPMAPGNSANQEPLCFTFSDTHKDLPIKNGVKNYPNSTPTASWIELYFETSPGAEVDLLSLTKLFQVEAASNVLEFSFVSVKAEDFTLSEPAEQWETLRRYEIQCSFTNGIFDGIVKFHIPPGLKDNRGNQSDEHFSIPLFKPY